MQKKYTLGIIGGGFMATAIINGVIKTGFIPSDKILVGEPNADRVKSLSDIGVKVSSDNRLVANESDYLLFAVKPQVFSAVAEELNGCAMGTVLSIMAGKTKAAIRSALKSSVKIARAMPNLPCSVGEGMIGLDVSEYNSDEKLFATGLFRSTGKVIEVGESLLNAVTGISGSGPAYVYLFLQSLMRAGTEQGLSEEQAEELALQTVKGGIALVESNPEKSLQQLIDAVSSKGGTTVAALGSFANDGFADSISRAVGAAVKRAEELSE